MAETKQTPTTDHPYARVDETPHQLNGQTNEQIQKMLAALGRHKNNPEYLERVFGEAEKARRQINAEYLRELDTKGSK